MPVPARPTESAPIVEFSHADLLTSSEFGQVEPGVKREFGHAELLIRRPRVLGLVRVLGQSVDVSAVRQPVDVEAESRVMEM